MTALAESSANSLQPDCDVGKVEEVLSMLRCYIRASEALLRLRADKDGVVSFEYVIVAACIVAAVAAAFGTSTASGIGAALTSAITTITTSVTNAVSA
ncbi:hypothetical protein [Bradyrhizobium sp. BR 1433]|uniref:hypothetical protein n=1 Tax=Bradyrhizobium sp. BR 1433 TaxID=3447967 RepID=UPI003EE50E99